MILLTLLHFVPDELAYPTLLFADSFAASNTNIQPPLEYSHCHIVPHPMLLGPLLDPSEQIECNHNNIRIYILVLYGTLYY
jgi:hypothetical protein